MGIEVKVGEKYFKIIQSNCAGKGRHNMRYAIYFTWNDGERDTVDVESKTERDFNIKDMLNRKEFKEISYCKIYHNGEYGAIKRVL